MTKPIDVDATWDGKGSLDEHRQKAFEAIEQDGFGSQSKSYKAKQAEKQTEVEADEE
ncbi:MAG TPA: hypothetical protein PK992_13890 [Planctomycetaceae bacterium]|nr:hypothetical protein [Planctomycetaceae bacterium]